MHINSWKELRMKTNSYGRQYCDLDGPVSREMVAEWKGYGGEL